MFFTWNIYIKHCRSGTVLPLTITATAIYAQSQQFTLLTIIGNKLSTPNRYCNNVFRSRESLLWGCYSYLHVEEGWVTLKEAYLVRSSWDSCLRGIKGCVIPTKSFVKLGTTKIFCYNNKMFSSINKTFGCCSKIFGCSNRKCIFVVPNFVAVTKPFLPWGLG